MSRTSRNKVLLLISILGLSAVAAWYLLKPFDYTVSFKSKASAGTINQTLKLWNTNLVGSKNIDQINEEHLVQYLKLDANEYIFDWKFSTLKDSLTHVNVGIKEANDTMNGKFDILFNRHDVKGQVKKTMSDFVLVLRTHLEKFRVTVKGESILPPTYCAYIPVKTKQFLKAKGMMENYGMLDNFLVENNVTPNGRPMVEIISWNRDTDSIAYNFCYPILKKDSLPIDHRIKYKELIGGRMMKAIYNGNYITSDRAWYALLEDAKKKHINLKQTPIEVFNTNPNMGSDELSWEAEIYMPIKN